MENAAERIIAIATTYGLKVVGAIVILIIGLWAAKLIKKMVLGIFKKRPSLDDMLGAFLASMAYYTAIAFVVIAVLQQFGVQTTSLVALLGAAGLAVGLALQGTLSNIAAGVMLLIFRPFRTGHFVDIGGTAGTVKDVGLFVTELATPDNVQILVPNGQIWGDTIKNFSAHPTRRVDIVFGVGYDADLNAAMATIREVIEADERVHKEPEPFVAVTNLGDSSVDITTRTWVTAADYWGFKFDMTKRVKEALDSKDITIPFPTRTIIQQAAE